MAAPSSAPCTSAHVGDPATPGVRMIIGGYDVRFPFKPYASQIGIASRVLKALDTGTNALLESPTGSGKSLALLCAALAWQERWKQDRENGGDVDETQGEHRDNGEQTNDPSTSSRDTTTKHDKKEAKQTKKVPRVYYATRTHSQIAQVVRELKRTSYRPLMTVLGSREHYCVNQKARTAAKKKGGNLGEECKSLLDAGGRGGGGGVRLGETDDDDQSNASKKTKGCGFSHGALKLASSVSKQNQDPVDIEDLVALGVKNKACPYFAAKQMQTTAELVFCPYNYLLDPAVRSAMDVDVAGSLIILDEAHNVEDTSREAASCDVHLHELILAQEEFQRVAREEDSVREIEGMTQNRTPSVSDDSQPRAPSSPSEHALIASVVGGVARWLAGASDQHNPRCPLRPHGFEKWIAVWSGGNNVERQLSDAGVSVENLDEIERARNFAVKMANDSKTPTHLRVNGSALKTCDTLLNSARYALRGRNRYEKNTGFGTNNASVDAYRLAVSKSFEDSSEKKEKVTLSLWALNPALAFADLTGPGPGTARSVVLTSGTLAPLDSFASELGAPFPIRMEAPHCVDVNTQVWAGAVASGTNGTKLSGTFKTSVEFAYQDDLGASLEKWCLEIPHGVLVFFPSYSLLDRVAQRWKATGAWQRIEQSTGKKLFTEPRGSGGGDFSAGGGGGRGGKGGRAGSKGGRGNARDASNGSLDDLLQKYYRAVRNSVAAAPHAHAPAPPTHACRGAVLLAVCRGKVSEGIDFADANARGVIVVGIPYPNLKDKQVELKRKYNDERARAGAGVLSGNEWYAQQAFRALNQAVGRCLRHRNDHGAVLLVDERYAHGGNGSLTANLPKWLRPALKKCADFGDSVIGLRLFFENRSANPPKPSSDLSVPTKLLPSVVGSDKQSAESKGSKKEADAKQRDIKNFFAPKSAAAAATAAALETAQSHFQVEEDNATIFGAAGDDNTTRNIDPQPRVAWRSAPVPVSFAPTTTFSMPPSQAPRDERTRHAAPYVSFLPPPAVPAELSLVFSQLTDPPSHPPSLILTQALVTSQLTDPPSEPHTQEVPEPETEPARLPTDFLPKATANSNPPNRATSDPALFTIPDEGFEWGDTSVMDTGGGPDSGSKEKCTSSRADDDETLSAWGETPGETRPGFGSRGWGATQQFRDFAPAPVVGFDPATKPTQLVDHTVSSPCTKASEPTPEPTPVPQSRVTEPQVSPVPRPAQSHEEAEAEVASPQNRNALQTNQTQKPSGLGFSRVARCRVCFSKSVSAATAFGLADAAEASATPVRRVCVETGGVSYLSVLVAANAHHHNGGSHGNDANATARTQVSSQKTQRRQRARLFLPDEPFPLRCASAVATRKDEGSNTAATPSDGTAATRINSTVPPAKKSKTQNTCGVYSDVDGCYLTPLQCKGVWVGVRVEATNGFASALVATASVEFDFSNAETFAKIRAKKTALKPGMVFFLEEAIFDGREKEEQGGGVPGSVRAVQAMEADSFETETHAFETEEPDDPFDTENQDDDRFDAENAPARQDLASRFGKRRRVRRKGSAEAARWALQSQENYGYLSQQVGE